MKPLLVDSSAWLDFFSKAPHQQGVRRIIDAKKGGFLAACGMIQLEVVRGARDRKEYRELLEEFEAMFWLVVAEKHWDLATTMGFELGKKGLRPPATDLLIAAVAIDYRCFLLHGDKHFSQIAEYFPLMCVSI